jgi:hypothetical protein
MEMPHWPCKISVKKTINNIKFHDEKISTPFKFVHIPVHSNKLESAKPNYPNQVYSRFGTYGVSRHRA